MLRTTLWDANVGSDQLFQTGSTGVRDPLFAGLTRTLPRKGATVRNHRPVLMTDLFVDDDAPTGDCGRGIIVDAGAHLIVIDHRIAVVLVPNLDAELVYAAASINVAIDGGQDEVIVSHAVDRA